MSRGKIRATFTGADGVEKPVSIISNNPEWTGIDDGSPRDVPTRGKGSITIDGKDTNIGIQARDFKPKGDGNITLMAPIGVTKAGEIARPSDVAGNVTLSPPSATVNAYFTAHSALLAMLKRLGIDAAGAEIFDERECAWAMDKCENFKGRMSVCMSGSKNPRHDGTITEKKNVRSADGLTFILSESRGRNFIFVLSDSRREDHDGWCERRVK